MKLLLIILSFVVSCAQAPVKKDQDLSDSETAKRELEIIQKRHQFENAIQYIQSLQTFIGQYSGTFEAEQAKFLLAEEFYKQNNYSDSYRTLNDIDQEDFPESSKQKLFNLFASNADRLNFPLEAVQWNVELYRILQDEDMMQKTHDEVQKSIDSKLTKEQLQVLIDKYKDSYPSQYVYFRLGKLFYEEGNLEESQEYLDKALELTKEESEKKTIQDFISAITKTYSVKRNVIGCILPLSGKYASFGLKSLKGIQQAFQFFSSEGKPYELAIYDSQGNPQEAAKGVEVLLEEHGVMGIIGPLLSQSSYEAAVRAQQLRVPLVNLSQHSTITDLGEYVYRLAMTRKNQVDALIQYACRKKGLKKFVLLYPEDNYGIEFANQFWDQVEECGGSIEGVEAYFPNQSDFNEEIRKLVGTHQPKARKEEYELQEAQLKIQLGKEEIPQSLVKLKPQVDFDALFIPDYAKTVTQIVPMMAYYDISGVTLLGTQGWNSKDLIERGGEYVEGVIFVDGFSQDSDSPQIKEFVQNFVSTFGYSPQIWEAQANDATNLLLALLDRPEVQTREDLKKELLALSEISGVTGSATFSSDNHDINKKLFLFTVKNRQIIPLE